MPNVKFACPDCGAEFEIQADYAIKGIEGSIQKGDGTVVRIVDPTEPHYCEACKKKALDEFLEKMNKEKENDICENQDSEN